MRYRNLGLTALKVSEIGFGCFGIGGDLSNNSYGPSDDAEATRAIEVALDLGCTLFDTADVYGFGHSEAVLGEALRRSRGGADVVVATKGGARFDGGSVQPDFSESHLRTAVEASLRRLQRDVIDLYQLHDPPAAALEDGRVFDALDRLAAEGKIRHHGVSIHSLDAAQAAAKRTACLQAALNVICLVEPGGRADDLLRLAETENLGLIAREPLASGFLSGTHGDARQYAAGDLRRRWPAARRSAYRALAQSFIDALRPDVSPTQAAIRFVLDHPQVSTTIVGVKTAEQARMNLKACETPAFAELLLEG